MKKLLLAETTVLLVLLVVAVFVRLGMGNASAQLGGPNQTEPQQSTGSTEDSPVIGPGYTDPQPTDTLSTQPTQEDPTWMTFPEGISLKAQQYFVYDVQKGEYLVCAGTVEDQIYPASITKLFTAYVAMQYLEPTDVITAKDALDAVVPGSSTAKIDWGDKLTVEMLVEAMLLPSGNDAAYILAVEVGRMIENNSRLHYSDAAIAFVEEMNRQAKELGMTGTHFVNPDGIHKENHYTSYQDLTKMAELALQNDTILKYASINVDYVTFVSGEEREWKNTNSLVNPESEYYCPYAVGLKTGQTPGAGACLLSAFQYQERTLIIGVFGCPDTDDRFIDTLILFNQAIGISQ